MRIAILLPTCEAYSRFAAYTTRRLDDLWSEHPPVFIGGLRSPGLTASACSLPCEANPSDWIGVALDAVSQLEAQGFDWLYLILDDHPPFGPCNTGYLNRQLPERAVALEAVHVNLQGWDQFVPQSGERLGGDYLDWQRNAADFKWKFSLHPGFWHVATLARMMRQLRLQAPLVRSARAFEGAMDAACRTLDPKLTERTYRIRGDGFAAGSHWFERRGSRAVTKRAIDVARFVSRLGGNRLLAALDGRTKPYRDYLNGPYPMFWSGLVRKGQLNGDALRFLRWGGQHALADEVRGTALQPTC